MLILLLLFAAQLLGQPVVIDAGGPGDVGFSSGTLTYTVPMMPASIVPPGTNDATMRYGPAFTYQIPVPYPGLYEVKLFFMEPTYLTPGQRIMAVTANSTPIIQGLDLVAYAGYLVPTAISAMVDVAGSSITLAFSASNGRNALVSSIAVSLLTSPSRTQLIWSETIVPQSADGTYLLPPTPPLAGFTVVTMGPTVFRNGVHKTAPTDYTVDPANPLHIIPTTLWLPGDTVLVDYWTTVNGGPTVSPSLLLCVLGRIQPISPFVRGLNIGVDYKCSDYTLSGLASYGANAYSCEAFLAPAPC